MSYYKYLRKATDVVGYTFHASAYCATCGDDLPEIDPEGNPKNAVFASDEYHLFPPCEGCDLTAGKW